MLQASGPFSVSGVALFGATLSLSDKQDLNMRIWLSIAAVFGFVAFFIWSSDRVTLQGERTIYTVTCEAGAWAGEHCNGKLAAADRFRFRALITHGEVVFWTAGSSSPSSKLTGCTIQSGREWVCGPSADAARAITLQMKEGSPVRGGAVATVPFHAVDKWRWYLLHWGLPAGSDADA